MRYLFGSLQMVWRNGVGHLVKNVISLGNLREDMGQREPLGKNLIPDTLQNGGLLAITCGDDILHAMYMQDFVNLLHPEAAQTLCI